MAKYPEMKWNGADVPEEFKLFKQRMNLWAILAKSVQLQLYS